MRRKLCVFVLSLPGCTISFLKMFAFMLFSRFKNGTNLGLGVQTRWTGRVLGGMGSWRAWSKEGLVACWWAWKSPALGKGARLWEKEPGWCSAAGLAEVRAGCINQRATSHCSSPVWLVPAYWQSKGNQEAGYEKTYWSGSQRSFSLSPYSKALSTTLKLLLAEISHTSF